jgi:beta-phosphoglucomutase-like phosphatase (HAD superfamily)
MTVKPVTLKPVATNPAHEVRLALICDCDGVLIDSEAVAARMLVHELQARWPDTDVEPVVLPLLGLRIERVLENAAAQLGRSLSAADVDAIRHAKPRRCRRPPCPASPRRSRRFRSSRPVRATASRLMCKRC